MFEHDRSVRGQLQKQKHDHKRTWSHLAILRSALLGAKDCFLLAWIPPRLIRLAQRNKDHRDHNSDLSIPRKFWTYHNTYRRLVTFLKLMLAAPIDIVIVSNYVY